jgi:hypothetical protein
MKLLSEYLQEPFDPKERLLDKILEEALAKQQQEKEHKQLVDSMSRDKVKTSRDHLLQTIDNCGIMNHQ